MSAADVAGGKIATNFVLRKIIQLYTGTCFAKFTFVSSNVCFVKLAKFREVVFRDILNYNGKLRNIPVLVRIFREIMKIRMLLLHFTTDTVP